MLLILKVVTLGQLLRHSTVSVRVRCESILFGDARSDVIRSRSGKDRSSLCLEPCGDEHHSTTRDPSSELFRVPTMQSHSSAGTLESWDCPARKQDGEASGSEVKEFYGRGGHTPKLEEAEAGRLCDDSRRSAHDQGSTLRTKRGNWRSQATARATKTSSQRPLALVRGSALDRRGKARLRKALDVMTEVSPKVQKVINMSFSKQALG